jgi:hypothetical protein
MRRIYIVGTVHNMLPKYEAELKSILKNINPDQILVEIADKDIKQKKFDNYPKEMVYAYQWATKNNKQAVGFDSEIKIEKRLSKKAKKEYEKKSFDLVAKFDWKELNKPEYDNYEEINDLLAKLIDNKKHKARQKEMLENIFKLINEDEVVLILTGVGHLKYFEENIKDAIFPFRCR